jgi:hypothetical protein
MGKKIIKKLINIKKTTLSEKREFPVVGPTILSPFLKKVVLNGIISFDISFKIE